MPINEENAQQVPSEDMREWADANTHDIKPTAAESETMVLKDSAILELRIKKLEEITKLQCQKGNYNVNDYMRGLANGLILAEAIMRDVEPRYFESFDCLDHLKPIYVGK